MNEAEDKGGILWGVVGFLIPIVGIVLYFVWKSTKPKTAKVALMGALISVGISLVFSIISAVLLAMA